MTDGSDPQQPTGAPGGSYSGIPPAGDFDQLTRDAGGLRSRRSMLGLAGAAIVAGLVAWFMWGRGGSRCSTASTCGDRHYCDEDETCICTETAEGDIKCGQLPPYCEVPLCATSADCAHLGDGFFCDTPNSGCCNDGHLSRCIAPCGTEYPPPPTTTTTSTTAPPDEGSEEEPEDEGSENADDGEPAHLRRTATQPDGVLFFTRREDGTAAYFYGLEGPRGVLQPTHVVFEDEDGVLATVVVNDEMLPVNWTASALSMAARAESRDTVLDPSDALHSVIVESEEWTLRANLVPKDLAGALTAADELTEERFSGARQVVRDAGGWTALVAAAQEPGDDQPQHIANALGLSIAHAVAVILEAAEDIEIDSDEDGDTSDEDAAAIGRALPISAPTAILPIYKLLSDLLGPLLESMLKNALLSLALEPLAPETPTDPTAPTFDLLLCQGATSWGTVCHYTYFDRSNIMGCLDFCKADLSCFTNICMPVTLAVDEVMQSW